MPSAAPLNRAIVRSVLTMRATIWARTSNSGPFNNAVKTGLACRLDVLSALSPRATSDSRAVIAAMRTLQYDTTYTMPDQAVQVEVTSPSLYAGQRWTVQLDTTRPSIPPGYDGPIAIEVDVVRAK